LDVVSSRYAIFDRSRLLIRPLSERVHDLQFSHWLSLEDATPQFTHPDLAGVASRMASVASSYETAIWTSRPSSGNNQACVR